MALPDESPIEALRGLIPVRFFTGRDHGFGIAGVETVGDLRRAPDARLCREPNLGVKSIALMRELLPRDLGKRSPHSLEAFTDEELLAELARRLRAAGTGDL